MSDIIFYIDGELEGTEIPLTVRAEWSDGDPYAVQLTFSGEEGGGTGITWMCSRDTLKEGIATGVAGAGDLIVRTEGPSVILCLKSPAGEAVIYMDGRQLIEFLDATYESVAAGSEAIPDTEFDKLLYTEG